ncbi:DUF4411 family protein [Granulicella mallensis]|uniref:DUF4411 family protein n=1 Tax=Granulicella mallensis TaxID=940614 RepID=A0A7W7ZPB7_9BACT|nr:DUF4411 family protein [Granulicella mallensis]MBB5063670.1 hypothetical protein [Granulicella mallensis]
MLYLLDANVLITANSTYYPLDQVPEFWSWVHHQAESNRLKIPREIMEEIKAGRKDDDPLLDWICIPEIESALLLDELVDVALVQHVVSTGYAADLSDDEVEKIGRDPFLIAYALADPAKRTVVRTEVSRPSAQRANRKVPDVCQNLGAISCGPFALNRALGFRTGWRT